MYKFYLTGKKFKPEQYCNDTTQEHKQFTKIFSAGQYFSAVITSITTDTNKCLNFLNLIYHLLNSTAEMNTKIS
jgi:hypothetical protein